MKSDTSGQREALIDATATLLWQQGYESTSPAAILSTSGSGQGSMYHHFAGKKALAIAAMERHEAVLWARSAELLASEEVSPLDAIEVWLKASRDALLGCRLGRLANEQSVRSDIELRAPLERYFCRLHARVSELLGSARRRGELNTTIKSKQLASMLVAVVQGGYVLSMATNDPKHMAAATSAAGQLLRSLRS
jgi:TetR/AcrR family transcriptional regulator, transcriptional repressor for nem operon